MHSTILTNLALLVASAIAQSSNANPFNIPNGGYALTAGQASTITWKPTTSGSVTLTLREGANSDLSKGTVIARTSASLISRMSAFIVLTRSVFQNPSQTPAPLPTRLLQTPSAIPIMLSKSPLIRIPTPQTILRNS